MASRTLGGRDEEDLLRERRKQYAKDQRDERMNKKLTRHRVQRLKRNLWWFSYSLAVPVAIGITAAAWKLAVWLVFE